MKQPNNMQSDRRMFETLTSWMFILIILGPLAFMMLAFNDSESKFIGAMVYGYALLFAVVSFLHCSVAIRIDKNLPKRSAARSVSTYSFALAVSLPLVVAFWFAQSPAAFYLLMIYGIPTLVIFTLIFSFKTINMLKG